MSAVNCPSSEDRAIEILPSQPDPPGEQSVLPPFSGKLRIDEQLKWRHENFKQTIDDFFSDKNITPLSQLSSTPAFPTPHVLAQFASKVYTDYKTGETDAQYETRLDLPNGWKLLTTASNGRRNNGYFGAAYWYPEHQQVVIAHRGTKLTKLEAMWTDIVEVIRKHHVPQMGSASTFAHKVVEDLRKVNQEKRTNFQVFFTGRFLGGWLAQITTFTTKCLKIEENTFLKSYNVSHSYHPHTVVFDSPGCKDMLSQMTDKLDVRLDGRAIDLEQLDITSYLSAPNRINTCNRHLGTVFRIFTGLSDMGWLETSNALYNSATQSRDIYVEFFDPENGQMYRDEQGKLKIQEVVDWPVTAGLSRDKQFKSFFNQVKNVNDYHPDIKEYTFQIKGYQPMRYQTKTYDDRVSRLSVFCQQERQFLESYFSLRQLPELFKPKDLFSVIEEKQSQKQAEKLLLGFEIENYTIRCTNANELQALIPYVKRLLELFPQLEEKTKGVLTQQQIGDNVYQFVTKSYVEIFHQSPLDFKPDALSLGDFLNSEERKMLHLRMVDGDAWTGLFKVYQVLEKTPSMTDHLNEGHYTIVKLEFLLLVYNLVNLNTLLQSTTAPHLLMMSCDTNQLLNVKTEQILRSLFSTLKQKQNVKMILTTQSEDDTVTFVQNIAKETLIDGFVTIDEQLTWCDLTRSSQENLLEYTVNSQESETAFNQLTSPHSLMTINITLSELLEERHIENNEGPVPICNCKSYDERYYIDRTFCHQVIIKYDILYDHKDTGFPDLLASSGQEFKHLCHQRPHANVHWLEKDKSGKLLWQKSQGSLGKLREYIDTEISHTYTADDLDKLLEQALHQGVVLISATAGMGKSTVLTHLFKQIKQKFPAKWVVRIVLNDHTDALEGLKKEQILKEKAIEFVSERLLKLKSGLQLELFKICCEQKQKIRIVIMLDGFDEISPNYKHTVIDLLQALRQTAVEQLWVTTRPHLREELEDKLQQLSYTLEPFSEENQVGFLKKFWCQKDWFTEVGGDGEEKFKTKLGIYAKHLIRKLSGSINDRDRQFIGIPLQCRMLAEAFNKEVKAFCQSTECVPELQFKLDLLGLYEIFFNKKYDICVEEKFKIPMTNVGAEVARRQWIKTNVENHHILALKMLFAEEQLEFLHFNNHCTSLQEDLTRTGIVQVGNEGKLDFIHRTFAEFYDAEYFVNELKNGSNISEQIQDFLLQKVLVEEEYHVIRFFIDGMLSRSERPYEVLKQYGNRIHDLGKDGVLTLNSATCEGNANIIGFLLDSVQVAGHADNLVKLWILRDDNKQTSWHVAAEKGQLQVLHKMWDLAKEVLTPEELNNKVLLAEDVLGRTAWHMAVEKGKLDVLQKLWEWAKEVLTPEEINNRMFLAKDITKRTAWHVAAEKGQLDILHKLWEWAKEVLTTEELNNLFLAKGIWGKTAWHIAAENGKLELLNKLWEWAKEVQTKEKLNNKLFFAKDNGERTAWLLAVEEGQIEVLHKLLEWAKEVLTPEEINNKMFLDKDTTERTAWHVAAEKGQLDLLHKLWESAKEVLTTEELNKLFLAKGIWGKTAWHLAAENGKLELLNKLWEWAKEVQTQEELINKLLFVKDNGERTSWHLAIEEGQIEILHNLLEWAKEVLTPEEINSKMFLAKDITERTAWHVAAEKGQLDLLHKFWDWAKEVLTPEELNKLFLAKGIWGKTAWHIAAEKGKLELLNKLWEWSKEVQTQEKLNKKLLLAKDNGEKTAWHLAEEEGQIEVLQKILEWAKNILTPEELKKMFFLDKVSGEKQPGTRQQRN